MEIRDKPEHDPVVDMPVLDAYMRWALLTTEEVVGRNGLAVLLRQIGLERLINNYPPEQLKFATGLTLGEYASFNADLINFFGRAARSMTLRIGRQSARHGIEHQGALWRHGGPIGLKGAADLNSDQDGPFGNAARLPAGQRGGGL